MKKLLAVLLSVLICATAVYTAIAADDETSSETPVVTEDNTADTSDDTDAEVEKIVTVLEQDDKAQEIAEQIDAAVKSGAAEDDVNSLLLALADYVNNSGYDVSRVSNKAGVKTMLDVFLTDCGVDTKELNLAIAGIKGDNGNSNNGSDADSNSDFNSDTNGSGYSDGSYYYSYDEATTIPDTGFEG